MGSGAGNVMLHTFGPREDGIDLDQPIRAALDDAAGRAASTGRGGCGDPGPVAVSTCCIAALVQVTALLQRLSPQVRFIVSGVGTPRSRSDPCGV